MRPPLTQRAVWLAARLNAVATSLIERATAHPISESSRSLLGLGSLDLPELFAVVASQIIHKRFRFADLRETKTKTGRPIYVPVRALDRVVYSLLADELGHALELSGVNISIDRGVMLAAAKLAVMGGKRWFLKTDFRQAFISAPLERALRAVLTRTEYTLAPHLAQLLAGMRQVHVQGRDQTRTPLGFIPPGVAVSTALLAAYLDDLRAFWPGTEVFLYVDDLLMLAATPEERDRAYHYLVRRSREKGMALHTSKKTEEGHVRDGFTFLGANLKNFTIKPKKDFAVCCRQALSNPSVPPARLFGLLGAATEVPGRASRALRREFMERLSNNTKKAAPRPASKEKGEPVAHPEARQTHVPPDGTPVGEPRKGPRDPEGESGGDPSRRGRVTAEWAFFEASKGGEDTPETYALGVQEGVPGAAYTGQVS